MIPVVAFDTETTGVDVERDRIVDAAIVLLRPNGVEQARRTWLINPGIPIPDEAAAVHGITTARARAEGQDPRVAIEEIGQMLARATDRGLPLVVYNAPFDLTILDREIRRHEVGIVGDIGGPSGLWWEPRRVLDPYVIDKHIDRYRRGKRTLEVTAPHYGVEFEGAAHGAVADALTAGRVMQRMRFPDRDDHPHRGRLVLEVAQSIDALHTAQIGWKSAQARSYAEYLAWMNATNPYDDGEPPHVDGSWPYRDTPE